MSEKNRKTITYASPLVHVGTTQRPVCLGPFLQPYGPNLNLAPICQPTDRSAPWRSTLPDPVQDPYRCHSRPTHFTPAGSQPSLISAGQSLSCSRRVRILFLVRTSSSSWSMRASCASETRAASRSTTVRRAVVHIVSVNFCWMTSPDLLASRACQIRPGGMTKTRAFHFLYPRLFVPLYRH